MGSRRRRVVWSEGARRELEDAIAYIAEDSPDGAVRFLDRILESAASLVTLAGRGRIVPERGDRAVRELLFDSSAYCISSANQGRDYRPTPSTSRLREVG